MIRHFHNLLLLFLVLLLPLTVSAQQQDRIQGIQKRLDSLSLIVTGLKQTVQLQVSGVTMQDYLIALGRTNNLSISVDPKLNFQINDVLNGVTASNLLVFLAKKYNLDINIVGYIIYVTPYQDPAQFIKPLTREIKASYNSANNTLSLQLENDTLAAVGRKITQISGKNVVVPTALQTKRVTAFIAQAPFETAMDKLAFLNEIKMVKTSDNYYLFQPLADNEELYVNGDKVTGVRRTFKPTNTGTASGTNLFTRLTNGKKVISADANGAPLAELVRQASQEMNKNYSVYSELKGNITIHVNDITYDNFLSLLFKGTDYTYHTENGVYLIGDRKLEGLRTDELVQLQHRAVDTVLSLIPAEWKKGIEIKEFREQNSLLLSGSAAQIQEVKSFIKQLDVLVPVILIEVTIIDINKTRTVSTGIAAGVSDSVKTGGTILPGIGFTFSATSVNSFLNSLGKLTSINLGHVVPNFYVSLNALENNGNIDVRSVPKLTALNGHTASLSIGSTRYYKDVTQNYLPSAANTQTLLSTVYKETDANLSIDIRPIVSGDDQVTLGVKVSIADFTAIPTDGSPPPKSISKFETSLRVHNEDTIVLGGIERTESDENTSGTPVLSRIPVLKWLFSNRTKSTSKVISVLFIKATIMH